MAARSDSAAFPVRIEQIMKAVSAKDHTEENEKTQGVLQVGLVHRQLQTLDSGEGVKDSVEKRHIA